MSTFTASQPLTRFNHSSFSSSRPDPFPSILCSRTDARHRSSYLVGFGTNIAYAIQCLLLLCTASHENHGRCASPKLSNFNDILSILHFASASSALSALHVSNSNEGQIQPAARVSVSGTKRGTADANFQVQSDHSRFCGLQQRDVSFSRFEHGVAR